MYVISCNIAYMPSNSCIGRHLEYIKMLKDARAASIGFGICGYQSYQNHKEIVY